MKKDSTALRLYFDQLPPIEARLRTTQLADSCKVARYTIYNWRYGKCRIPALAKDKIEEVLGKKIFDSLEFTEDNVKKSRND